MSSHLDADVIIIGSGHNGLVCAAYLAQWGYKTLVLERRNTIGGAVCTEEMFGGFKMDVGGSLHCMIRMTPIVSDLSLVNYGLEYIPLDPIMSAPFDDGTVISFYRDLEQTCKSIAQVSERDADMYRSFVEEWRPLNQAIFDLFLHPPKAGNFISKLLLRKNLSKKSGRLEMFRRLLQSYGRVTEDCFTNEKVRATLSWWAAQSGPPPNEAASSEFLGWQSLLHDISPARPKGGSGMLTTALGRFIEAHGGTIAPNTEVTKIITREGRARGVRTKEGRQYSAKAVVSNAHVLLTFCELLRDWTPTELRSRVNQIRVGNGFGMALRCAVDSLPRYSNISAPRQDEIVKGLQLICPSRQYLMDAYADFLRGEPARRPALIAMTFSAIDQTLAPPGKHILFLWGQYYPYQLRNGLSWINLEKQCADTMLKTLEQFAPGIIRNVIDTYVQTPVEIERKHAMPNANVMHVDMSIDQMFSFRPLPELSKYTTPLPGLYLASASAHPGGGIFGAAGYNCSKIVRTMLRKR